MKNQGRGRSELPPSTVDWAAAFRSRWNHQG